MAKLSEAKSTTRVRQIPDGFYDCNLPDRSILPIVHLLCSVYRLLWFDLIDRCRFERVAEDQPLTSEAGPELPD